MWAVQLCLLDLSDQPWHLTDKTAFVLMDAIRSLAALTLVGVGHQIDQAQLDWCAHFN